MSDHARKLIGIETINADGEHWTGKGELVGIVDSGVDATHPDLAGRVASDAAQGGTADDQFGHGTHVSGTIAGDGQASNGQIRGMAPDAEVTMLGIVRDSGKLALPPDIGDLLRNVADKGAKVINLSWGTPVSASYEGGAMAVDTFVRERPDVLVVVAAGNCGTAPKGHTVLGSVGSPATAKNALTVGACQSDRGDFPDTWGKYKPELFPEKPTSEQLIVGDPTLPAATSSRGPTDFDSIKPDLLAPGTGILAARAANVADRYFWKPCAGFGGRYAYLMGTSMAAPVVTGAAAVTRQYLREARKVDDPSAALLKAILIAAALREPNPRGADGDKAFGYPDFDQGFGRLDLSMVLPHPGAPPERNLSFVDVPDDDPKALESRAQPGAAHKAIARYSVNVKPGAKEPLCIVLVWTDYSVRAVQNSLALDVAGPGGLRCRGNDQHCWNQPPMEFFSEAAAEKLRFDRRNTVQQALIKEPAAGTYRIRVLGQNTLFPPQGYALVVCGELDDELQADA
jgi:serine protease AprX